MEAYEELESEGGEGREAENSILALDQPHDLLHISMSLHKMHFFQVNKFIVL